MRNSLSSERVREQIVSFHSTHKGRCGDEAFQALKLVQSVKIS